MRSFPLLLLLDYFLWSDGLNDPSNGGFLIYFSVKGSMKSNLYEMFLVDFALDNSLVFLKVRPVVVGSFFKLCWVEERDLLLLL